MGTPRRGDSPARCSATPCTTAAPLPWPEVLVHPRLGTRHPPHMWHPLPQGRAGSGGEMASEEPGTGTVGPAELEMGSPAREWGDTHAKSRLSPTECPLSLTCDPGTGALLVPMAILPGGLSRARCSRALGRKGMQEKVVALKHLWLLPQQRQLCAQASRDWRRVCGDTAGHRPGAVPIPTHCPKRPRQQQGLEWVGMRKALSWRLFLPSPSAVTATMALGTWGDTMPAMHGMRKHMLVPCGTVDATPEQGHGECHVNPAQHQDMGHHAGPAWPGTGDSSPVLHSSRGAHIWGVPALQRGTVGTAMEAPCAQ